MRWGVVALSGALLFGCSMRSSGYGGDCARSLECKAGLVCIEGTCTNDLSLIEDPGAVPMLNEPDAGAMVVDAALTDGMAPLDATPPASDAAPPPVEDAAPPLDATAPPAPDAG
jgi:hypothetical protein